MPVTNVYVFGASGRMGGEIQKVIESDAKFNFVGGQGRNLQDPVPEHTNVVIDFSLPDGLEDVLNLCRTNGVPLVSGTTGFSPSQKSQLIELSKELPIFWAANMSFGVHILNQLIQKLAGYHNEFTFKIRETHHVKKVDAPSGTALAMKKAAQSGGVQVEDIASVREGEVFGHHVFSAENTREKIEISHEAISRDLFAVGALKISRWLSQQPIGFYSMDDYFESPGSSPAN